MPIQRLGVDDALAPQMPHYLETKDPRGVALWSIDPHNLNGKYQPNR